MTGFASAYRSRWPPFDSELLVPKAPPKRIRRFFTDGSVRSTSRSVVGLIEQLGQRLPGRSRSLGKVRHDLASVRFYYAVNEHRGRQILANRDVANLSELDSQIVGVAAPGLFGTEDLGTRDAQLAVEHLLRIPDDAGSGQKYVQELSDADRRASGLCPPELRQQPVEEYLQPLDWQIVSPSFEVPEIVYPVPVVC